MKWRSKRYGISIAMECIGIVIHSNALLGSSLRSLRWIDLHNLLALVRSSGSYKVTQYDSIRSYRKILRPTRWLIDYAKTSAMRFEQRA